MKNLFTSESVSVGHPDFVASAIGDALLDYCVSNDKKSRCGIEVMCVPNRVILGGEVTTEAPFDDKKIQEIVKDTIIAIGYTQEQYGFWACTDEDCSKCVTIENYIHKQSPDINMGVDRSDAEIGAGDLVLLVA